MGRMLLTVAAFWAILCAVAVSPVGSGVAALAVAATIAWLTLPVAKLTAFGGFLVLALAALATLSLGGRAWAARRRERAYAMWVATVMLLGPPILLVTTLRNLGLA